MATITASIPTSSVSRAGLWHKGSNGVSSSAVLGLPEMVKRGRVRCSAEEKPYGCNTGSIVGMGASLMAAAAMASPAIALVDERLSTEGTGLPFGLSNNILGWILFGVFALIWSLYFVYTSSLDEDDDSGLSL
ncbi:hypothetical protein HHK36_026838 [Tetracentron sinense]|uniref:PSII 6.1 kDa protein n=1 Tax=Tetracentron sinense TaxID=13715 RepID=A0A835D4Z8_TETSI|nr:hypothetical protein HHK36_026838 [Tetracentron sinense]